MGTKGVFLVVCSTGEYSDRRESVVCGHSTMEDAERHSDLAAIEEKNLEESAREDDYGVKIWGANRYAPIDLPATDQEDPFGHIHSSRPASFFHYRESIPILKHSMSTSPNRALQELAAFQPAKKS